MLGTGKLPCFHQFEEMGKQYNKVIKRRRRNAYKDRVKARDKAQAKVPAARKAVAAR